VPRHSPTFWWRRNKEKTNVVVLKEGKEEKDQDGTESSPSIYHSRGEEEEAWSLSWERREKKRLIELYEQKRKGGITIAQTGH